MPYTAQPLSDCFPLTPDALPQGGYVFSGVRPSGSMSLALDFASLAFRR